MRKAEQICVDKKYDNKFIEKKKKVPPQSKQKKNEIRHKRRQKEKGEEKNNWNKLQEKIVYIKQLKSSTNCIDKIDK